MTTPLRRADIATPALIVDVAALDANIARMAALAAAAGVGLRPHAKTHKCARIARRQIDAGAVGICCAKVGEAEALASEGVDRILITSPVVHPAAVARLAALNRAMAGLMAVVDHPANAAALADAAGDGPLDVLIDIDPGIHRTGVASPEAAVELATAIAGQPALHYRGVQFYCGAQQHIADPSERQAAIAERSDYLRAVVAALTDAGHAPQIVTGSGTGSHEFDLASGLFTDLQVGSYVFMDRQYERCWTPDADAPFANSLFVDATVISANSPGLVTVDAGYKALSSDGDLPRCVTPGFEGASFAFMGDEHGAVYGFDPANPPALGQRLSFVPPHCDPTVNLYDRMFAIDDGAVSEWPVEARGRSA